MPAIALRAHYDGKNIHLDEKFDLPPNAQLIVTVLPTADVDENAAWGVLAAQGLAKAYGDDAIEPEYSLSDVKL